MNARIKEPEPSRPALSHYDPERREELRRKHRDDSAPKDWQDIQSDDAGIPRYGEI